MNPQTSSDKRSETARALIGQCLWRPEKINGALASRVSSNDMPQPWGMVWEIVKTGITDVPMIALRLPAEVLSAVGGEVELSALSTYGGGNHSEEHAKNLLNYSARVRLADLARQIIAETSGTESEPDAIIRKAVDSLARVGIDAVEDFEPIGEVVRGEIERIKSRAQNPRDVWGIPFGLPRFDRETGGAQQGELTLLVGEPGLGKTWLAMGAAVEMGKKEPGIILSMEMKREAQARRLLSGNTGVPTRAMKSGNISAEQLTALDSAAGIFDKLPIGFSDRNVTTDALNAMLARAKVKSGIKWAWIDYLMLFNDQARDEIAFTAHVSRALKVMSVQLDIAICCIHSVTKSGMDSDDSDPAKSSARGSGQLLHDADMIMYLTKFKPLAKNDREKLVPDADREKMAILWTTKGRELEQAKLRDILRRKGDSPFWGEATL